MSFHQKIPALSLISVLLLGLTGCSEFITLKDTASYDSTVSEGGWPETTSSPKPTPYSTPDVPAAKSIPKDTYVAPAPQPLETAAATPEVAIGMPMPQLSSPEYMSPEEESSIRTNANATLDKILYISRSPAYRKLATEAESIQTMNDHDALKKLFANNREAIESIHEVQGISGDYSEVYNEAYNRVGAKEESDEFIRDFLVVPRFLLIMKGIEGQDGFLNVAPGAIIKQKGEYYIKVNNYGQQDETVVFQNPGVNKYRPMPNFEGMRLKDKGTQFVFDFV